MLILPYQQAPYCQRCSVQFASRYPRSGSEYLGRCDQATLVECELLARSRIHESSSGLLVRLRGQGQQQLLSNPNQQPLWPVSVPPLLHPSPPSPNPPPPNHPSQTCLAQSNAHQFSNGAGGDGLHAARGCTELWCLGRGELAGRPEGRGGRGSSSPLWWLHHLPFFGGLPAVQGNLSNFQQFGLHCHFAASWAASLTY